MSIWFPMLPVDAWRRRDRPDPRDARAVLIAGTDGPRRVVSACCTRALAHGVRPGATLADARSSFAPDAVRVVPDDPARTAGLLETLGRWAHRFSPRVAPDPPDGLLIDLTGCARSLGGEPAIRDAALRDLARLGVAARCVIAPAFAAAAALARHHPDAGIVSPSDLPDAVSALPTAALGVDARTVQALAEVGIERLAHLIDMPRSVLPARFGPEPLLRLDRILGRAIETIEPLRPAEPVRAAVDFDGPTHRWESIEHVLAGLLDEVCARLTASDRGVLRLVLTLKRSDLPPAVLACVVSRPTRDPRHLWTLLRPRLERTHLGFGIEGIDLHAERCARIGHLQTDAWGSGDDGVAEQEAFARLVDTLSNRLGRERVLRAGRAASHRPERAAVLRPATDPEGPAAGPTPPTPPAPRPTRLFARPGPVGVLALTPDGPVHRLSDRAGPRAVITCIGPERIGPEWWRVARPRATTRDYFTLQDEDGRWVWIFRELETGRWFVHGEWS